MDPERKKTAISQLSYDPDVYITLQNKLVGHSEICPKFKMAAIIQNGCYTLSRKNRSDQIKLHVNLFV